MSLGNDDLNVKVATRIRMIFRRLGIDPAIRTMVYNHNTFNALMSDNAQFDKNKSYQIIPFGDVDSTYTEECMLKSSLENEALARHLAYTKHSIDNKKKKQEIGYTDEDKLKVIAEAQNNRRFFEREIDSVIKTINESYGVEFAESHFKRPVEDTKDYITIVPNDLAQALVKNGLNNAEAQALVEKIQTSRSFNEEEIAIIFEEDLLTEEKISKILEKAEEEFWGSDYNYRSSVASVLHLHHKKNCNMPGSKKAPSERTDGEKELYRVMEHARWNAYVRSEGYVYAPKRDKLAKTHHLLIPFDELPESEKVKDDD